VHRDDGESAPVTPDAPRPRKAMGFAPKPKSLGLEPLTAAERAEKERIDADPELLADLAARPRRRSECADGPRPCPWASCRYHLGFDITDRGAVQQRFPHLRLSQLRETCALDVADRGGVTLEEVGRLSNTSMQAASQTIEGALAEIRQGGVRRGWANFVSVERLRRVRRAAAQRAREELEKRAPTGPWGHAGRAPGEEPCPRCARCISAPPFGAGRFTHTKHLTPDGQPCRGEERARHLPASER
jgi:hypothetical protein